MAMTRNTMSSSLIFKLVVLLGLISSLFASSFNSNNDDGRKVLNIDKLRCLLLKLYIHIFVLLWFLEVKIKGKANNERRFI